MCEKYQYLSIEGNVEYYERLESKYKFDHFNFDKYVFGQVCKERDKFEEVLDAVEINRRLLTEFEEEYKLLPDFTENPPSWIVLCVGAHGNAKRGKAPQISDDKIYDNLLNPIYITCRS